MQAELSAPLHRRSGDIRIAMTKHPTTGGRRSVIAAGAIGLAVVTWVLVGLYRRYDGEPRRFAAVEEGVLYRSGQPKPGEIGHLIKRLGLRTLIIAREDSSENVQNELAFARRRGLNIVHLPLESRTPIPDDQIERFFRVVDDPRNRPALVHCSAGRHRTGLLCALYRIERQGWSREDAIAEMRSFDPDMDRQRPVFQQLKRYEPGRLSRASDSATAAKVGGVAPPP